MTNPVPTHAPKTDTPATAPIWEELDEVTIDGAADFLEQFKMWAYADEVRRLKALIGSGDDSDGCLIHRSDHRKILARELESTLAAERTSRVQAEAERDRQYEFNIGQIAKEAEMEHQLDAAEMALRAVEIHHVEINRKAGRLEECSATLGIVREYFSSKPSVSPEQGIATLPPAASDRP